MGQLSYFKNGYCKINCKNKTRSNICTKRNSRFLSEKLELSLNSKTQIFKGKQGVNFCGYKINEYRIKLRDKGKRKLKKKIKKLKNKIYLKQITSQKAKKYLAGHLGYIKYANVNNLINSIFMLNKIYWDKSKSL